MGLFSTIVWNDQLPFSKEMLELDFGTIPQSFQTKDFDNALETYFVKGKTLFLEKFESTDWVEADKNDKSFMGRFGHYKKNKPYLEKALKTQVFVMYNYLQDVKDKWDCSVEFEVFVNKGKIKSVTLKEFAKIDNAIRLENEAKWQAERLLENSRWCNRLIFHARWYRPISAVIRKSLYSISGFFNRLAFKF
jgi:hypothetical protein